MRGLGDVKQSVREKGNRELKVSSQKRCIGYFYKRNGKQDNLSMACFNGLYWKPSSRGEIQLTVQTLLYVPYIGCSCKRQHTTAGAKPELVLP